MSKSTKTSLTKAEREVIEEMIRTSSIAAVAKTLQVAPGTLRTVVGGLMGHRGTIALIRQGLAVIDQEGGGLEVQLKDPDGENDGGLR